MDKKTVRWKIALVLILVLSMLTVAFSGCVEEEAVTPTQPVVPRVEAAPTPKPNTTPLPTPTPAPTPTPTPTPKLKTPDVTVTTPTVANAPQSWRSVTEFTGKEDFSNEPFPFPIEGLVWRVHWSYTGDPAAPNSSFSLFAWRENKQCISCCLPLASVELRDPSGSGVIDVFPGNSTYYVEVFADNLEGWTLEVEEFV
ncbi:hypothetical protein ACFLY8_01235 [Halobacteriota archaeon]